MRPPRLLVLDFDGTVTDVEVEGVPFRKGYLADLATLTGRPPAEIAKMAADFEAEVAADLDRYGWVFEGQVVAPAQVDPYLRMMPVSRMIFDACGVLVGDDTLRDRLLSGVLYKHNYASTAGTPAFKPEAAAFLGAVATGEPVTWVVTNSDTGHVTKKIAKLAEMSGDERIGTLVDRTVGNAKKYVVDPTFDGAPAALELPGLRGRVVLPRRRLYFEALDTIRRGVGAEWADVLVAGDIFELDLALPWSLGARVALVRNAHTPAYEVAFVSGSDRGWVIEDLRELLPMVGR